MFSPKNMLLTSSALAVAASVAFSGQAMAQDVPADIQEAVTVDEIVVTGSRIKRPQFQGTNPVASVTSEALVGAGVTNVTDFLTDSPALVGSTTLQDNSNGANRGSVGLNLLDLRNLGTQRTLVLVNGRRHVASQAGSTSVDINSIPVALIERVDVMTGGASAIYGADGVSGVVNFVLKKDFEGLDARAQYGASEHGGGENAFVSILAGKNFLDGRVNFTLGLEHSQTQALESEQRSFSRVGEAESVVVNPNYGQPGEYRRIFAKNVRYIDTSAGGSVYTRWGDTTSGVTFNGDGTPFQDGIYTSGASMIGGDGTPVARFNTNLMPELERSAINATFNVELAPNHYAFGEAKYVNTQTQFFGQPSWDYGLFLPIDNAFMPESIRNDALASGGFANADSGEDYLGGVMMARDNFDFGRVMRDIERETFRGVFGVRGDINPHLSYEASLNYGKTIENNVERNNRINERYFAAIDAVRDANGNIVCRSDLDPTAVPVGDLFGGLFDGNTWGTTFTPGANSGCVPMNVFGEGSPSKEALAWIMSENASKDVVEQFVFNAFVSGDFGSFLELPGGPISYSAGVEYRKEKARAYVGQDQLIASQLGYNVTFLGQGSNMAGEFDVKEAFGEISLPLLADKPFIKELTLDGAYRWSDYSSAGKTESYKVGLMWAIDDNLFLRGTGARSVRAPSISDLFLPLTQTYATLSDPCDLNNFQNGDNPAVREANCRAMLGLGANDENTFVNTNSSSVEGVVGGNSSLEPEEADTFTAGFVFTPTFLRGFSLALDYYDIKLSNAIQFFSAQNITNKCYDLPQPNQFCDLIGRNPNTNLLESFEQFGVNVAEYRTSGWDLSIDYLLDPARFGYEKDIGTFRFSLSGNKLDKLQFIEDPADPLTVEEDVGTARVPEYQAQFDVNWKWQDVSVTYGYNWFDETRRYEGVQDDYIDPRYFNHDARSTHDLQVRYQLRDSVSVYGGVNNLTDEQPSRGTIDYPVSPLGRYFYMGVNLSL